MLSDEKVTKILPVTIDHSTLWYESHESLYFLDIQLCIFKVLNKHFTLKTIDLKRWFYNKVFYCPSLVFPVQFSWSAKNTMSRTQNHVVYSICHNCSVDNVKKFLTT